jgi:hypothetical protein
VNKGTISIATGVSLSAPSNTPTISNETGGTIAATGTGAFVQRTGTFNEGAGKTTGTEPVILDDQTLNYTGKGASEISLRGASTLTGTINSGQELAIQSSCSEHATTSAAGFVNSGIIDLTNGDACGNNATLNLSGGTLENKGTINSESPHGGARTIEGSVKNEKTVSLSAGETMKVTGTYTQSAKGTLKVTISGAAPKFGALAVTGTATIAGTLALSQVKFTGKADESFAILGSSALTGTFAKETGGTFKKTPGLYYKPTYSASGVTLVITQGTLLATPTEGAAGSKVTLKGSGYPGGDTVNLSFTDSAKVTTVLPSTTANASGEFTAEVTVPAGAAKGASSFSATSTLTGVVVMTAFTVT